MVQGGIGETLDRGEEVFIELLVSLPVYTTTPVAVPALIMARVTAILYSTTVYVDELKCI